MKLTEIRDAVTSRYKASMPCAEVDALVKKSKGE